MAEQITLEEALELVTFYQTGTAFGSSWKPNQKVV